MEPTALLLAALVQAGPSGLLDDARRWPNSATSALETSAESNRTSNPQCLSALGNADIVHPGTVLSAFRLFNPHPPSRESIPLEDAQPASRPRSAGLISCVEDAHFSFAILIDGVLTEGTSSQMYPVTAWKTPRGYLAFFLHKNYEAADGEGETIELSALALDLSGRPIQRLPAVSSWYAYEGALRIRDFVYADNRFMTTEQVFEPLERDGSGHVLTYGERVHSRTTSVHEIDWMR